MKNKLELLVIHCTATKEGVNVGPNWIRQVHLSPPPIGRGWKQVGYRDMIMLDGSIENLVPYNLDEFVDPWEITNGVAGLNSKAFHIVYAGGLDKNGNPKDTRTPQQEASMDTKIKWVVSTWPNIRIAGHYQFAKKACPSFNVAEWCQSIGIDEKNIY